MKTEYIVALIAIVALAIWWFFFRKQMKGAGSAAPVTSAGNSCGCGPTKKKAPGGGDAGELTGYAL